MWEGYKADQLLAGLEVNHVQEVTDLEKWKEG